MQRTPNQFDQNQLKINIECPEPVAAGMSFIIENRQPVISASPKKTSQPPEATQERFQVGNILARLLFYVL